MCLYDVTQECVTETASSLGPKAAQLHLILYQFYLEHVETCTVCTAQLAILRHAVISY